MRDEKEGRKKQTMRQSNTTHPRQSLSYMYMYMSVINSNNYYIWRDALLPWQPLQLLRIMASQEHVHLHVYIDMYRYIQRTYSGTN